MLLFIVEFEWLRKYLRGCSQGNGMSPNPSLNTDLSWQATPVRLVVAL